MKHEQVIENMKAKGLHKEAEYLAVVASQNEELLNNLKVMHRIVDCMGDKPDVLIDPDVWFYLKCEDALTNSAKAIFKAEK